MISPVLGYASALALLSVVSAQSNSTYPANTNTNCATASDVVYQGTYYYNSSDVMDWGVYTQSQGTCDTGSYARVHLVDPSNNDIPCGYVALDGNLHLISCDNYPRGYMTEGLYTIYWETIPGAGQYSWNQFTVSHSQSTVTAAVPTQTVTTTPLSIITATITSTPTSTQYNVQTTVTSPSGTMTNVVSVTLPATTITTTSTNVYSFVAYTYTQATVTAVTTAPCHQAPITKDNVGTRKVSGSGTTTTSSSSSAPASSSNKKTSSWPFFWWWRRSMDSTSGISRVMLRLRDDVPNTVGAPGQPLTTTVTPPAVITTVTAATATTTITSTTLAPTVTVTSGNPTPTVTVYSGMAVQTTTVTAPRVTKSVVKNAFSVAWVTSTVTLTYTKKSVTTPICSPTPI